MSFQKNQELTLSVLELNMLGYGVAKKDGAVFFIQNALPGEVCRCRIIKCAKNYYVARVMAFLETLPQRREPLCPGWRRCGGCVFQHASYELELETKRRFVEDQLRKAGLGSVAVEPVLSTGQIEHYRNKAQFPVGTDEEGNLIAGFFATKSHKIISIEDCAIQDARFAPIVREVLAFCRETGVTAYAEETGQGLLRHLYLRVGQRTGELMLCLVLTEDRFPREEDFCRSMTEHFPAIKSIVFNMNSEKTNVILGKKNRIVWGSETISDRLCGKDFFLSPLSFYQVNRDGAELLYQSAFAMAGITAETPLVDLYCGVGTIGQSAAAPGQAIYGVEIIEEAVKNARENALCNDLTNARYLCGDAASLFQTISPDLQRDALLILDPPRKGLSPDLIRQIHASAFQKILYISCSPETLARDLAQFSFFGFTFDRVQPVDLFPRTAHVESIVVLHHR